MTEKRAKRERETEKERERQEIEKRFDIKLEKTPVNTTYYYAEMYTMMAMFLLLRGSRLVGEYREFRRTCDCYYFD